MEPVACRLPGAFNATVLYAQFELFHSKYQNPLQFFAYLQDLLSSRVVLPVSLDDLSAHQELEVFLHGGEIAVDGPCSVSPALRMALTLFPFQPRCQLWGGGGLSSESFQELAIYLSSTPEHTAQAETAEITSASFPVIGTSSCTAE